MIFGQIELLGLAACARSKAVSAMPIATSPLAWILGCTPAAYIFSTREIQRVL